MNKWTCVYGLVVEDGGENGKILPSGYEIGRGSIDGIAFLCKRLRAPRLKFMLEKVRARNKIIMMRDFCEAMAKNEGCWKI